MPPEIEVALLTGGGDKPYAFGLALALLAKGVRVDFIGSDDLDSRRLRASPGLRFRNLRGAQRRQDGLARKAWRILLYYGRLTRYAATARATIFHILWNNKFEFFDRTVLMLYYRLRGKTIVLTAHNVNARRRDLNDSLLNRLTLRIQYRLADHIFVHTDKMRRELFADFGVPARAVTVVPFGINNDVPETDLTPQQAKERLGIDAGDRTILFFGTIRPYKGLDYLVSAFRRLLTCDPGCRLIIAGEPKPGSERYLAEIERTISRDVTPGRVIAKIDYIPDDETELYFKAADVLVLPYTEVSQSGVLFLGYRFGLPAIASDVGSFREDIIEGMSGFVCAPSDPVDLCKTVQRYFDSDLFRELPHRRQAIRDYAHGRHSWDTVAEITRTIYTGLRAATGPPNPGRSNPRHATSDVPSRATAADACSRQAGMNS